MMRRKNHWPHNQPDSGTATGRRSAALGLLLAAVLPLPLAVADEKPAPLELTTCELTLPGTSLTTPAECGWFEVAENPAEPQGRQIKLRVARIPATDFSVEPDPLVLLAGGPGQAASEAWLYVAQAFRKLTRNRDVLLIDQRGTGQSNALRCPQVEMAEALALDWDELEHSTRACLESLDGDPRFYTTEIAMRDYDQVRAALGYEKLNLFGVSYGTRAAQVYLRLFPDRVRTVVLDSVIPQSLILGTEHAVKLDQALQRIFAACDADDACAAAFPDTARKLRQLMRTVDNPPVNLRLATPPADGQAAEPDKPGHITVAHPLTGEPFELDFDRDVLASAIRFLAYSSETQAMLPLLIHEAATQHTYQRLASQMLITASGLTESIAQGMELSVVCSEDYPWFPPENDRDNSYLMGNSMTRATHIQCGLWPRGDVSPDFHQPVSSDVPTLLLSGEWDPVTPPEYAEEVKQYFSNSLHLVAPGQGHSVTGRGCLGGLVSDFIIAASVDELETDCVAQLQPSPWFMSLIGPNP